MKQSFSTRYLTFFFLLCNETTTKFILKQLDYSPSFSTSDSRLGCASLTICSQKTRARSLIVNYYSLTSRWVVAEYLPSRKVARSIFCQYFLRLKGTIIILFQYNYTHEAISTTLNLNICLRKPFKVKLIDILKSKFMSAILFHFLREGITLN